MTERPATEAERRLELLTLPASGKVLRDAIEHANRRSHRAHRRS